MDTFNLGRFSDPPILILASLAGSPKYGYATMEDIEGFAGVHLGPCMVPSRAWRRRGLIEPLPTEERRRPYRLTATGIAFLQKQLAGLETFTRMGLQRVANI